MPHPQRAVAPQKPVPRVDAAAAPAISIIIPTYNRADLIVQTLESVRAQTFADWECIIVDDGSTDDTAKVIAGFLETDARFRYITRSRSTASAARNHGMREARGRYVTFLDSDDLFPAERLAWQFRELEADPEAVLAYGDSFCFWNDDLGRMTPYNYLNRPLPSGWGFETMLQCGCVAAPLTRTEAVRRTAGFDESLPTAEDWDMWLSLAKIGRVIYRPQHSLYIRRHGGNKSANAPRNYRGLDYVVRKQLRGLPLRRRLPLYRAARRFFRSGPWLDAMLAEVNTLNDAADWPRARVVWRTVAHLDPGLLRQPRVFLNVVWALVPTHAGPPWRPLWRRLQRLSSRQR